MRQLLVIKVCVKLKRALSLTYNAPLFVYYRNADLPTHAVHWPKEITKAKLQLHLSIKIMENCANGEQEAERIRKGNKN